MTYKPLTKETLNKAIEELKKDSSNERKIKFRQYCKTNGTVLFDSSSPFVDLCGDPECKNCRRFESAFKERVEELIEKLENNGSLYLKIFRGYIVRVE